MRINSEKCSGCGTCIPFCPVGAIRLDGGRGRVAVIDESLCVECGTCARTRVVRCPKGAIEEDPGVYEGVRAVSKYFSDPMAYHPHTRVPRRGTEEVKTNDVTGRIKLGEVGIGIEMGRPCLGCSFRDIELLTSSLASLGARFEGRNPLTALMVDPHTGKFPAHLKTVKLMSAIVEFTVPIAKVEKVLQEVVEVARLVDTVSCLDIISCYTSDGRVEVLPYLERLGLWPRPNAKVNLGMGRRQ